MKLEQRSKTLLAITKSKAKMYEFDIDEKHHIDLKQDPKKLLILTIGILGELSAIESRSAQKNNATYIELKEQLVSVSQYFDVLKLSNIDNSISNYLRLVGSAAYYLADMPGSSLVLSKEISYNIPQLTPSYLEGILVWLLKSDFEKECFHFEVCDFSNEIELFVNTFTIAITNPNGRSAFYKAALNLKEKIYLLGNDRELLFVDVSISLSFRKIEYSSIYCLSKYTKLNFDFWQPALRKKEFIKEFWPAQRLLGEHGVLAGASAVVQMPTSAGKTKSTELIIRSAFLSGRANLVIVIAPFRALCREISATFQRAFDGEDVDLNELQDIIQVNKGEDEFIKAILNNTNVLQSKTIIVSTPEKLVYLLRHEPLCVRIVVASNFFNRGKT
ncbi:MAG: DEAD/DEAH box helicase [Proteobacteria bacterium]|nr:DEAD/DEAH box helicase [Pseudomonadota bacterium]